MRVLVVIAVAFVALLGGTVHSVVQLLSYEDGTAAEKQATVLGLIVQDTTPGKWPTTLEFGKLFIESMLPTMNYISDVMPSGRQKLIHSVGAAASCKFVMQPNNYTGLFQGSNYALIRLSPAVKPDTTKDISKANFVPGSGFKLFRDGVPSANFVAMHLLSGQDSWNFFKYPLSNHLSTQNIGASGNVLKKKFETVTGWAAFVGLSDMAMYDESGKAETNATVNFPWQILLYPNPDVTAMFTDNFTQELIPQLETIPIGTKLYIIMAIPAPYARPQYIGDIYTTGTFTSSVYADETLFLRHITMETDLKLRPAWTKVCPKYNSCPVCPIEAACGPATESA